MQTISGNPVRENLEEMLEERTVRFSAPGHQGKLPFPLEDAAPYDITPSRRAVFALEEQYAAAFGSAGTLLSTAGVRPCLQAMLFLARQRGRKIIAVRTLSSAVITTMGLLGLEPIWVGVSIADEEDEGLTAMPMPVSLERIAQAVEYHPDAAAVLLSSIDCCGQMPGMAEIADCCRAAGMLLMVDNTQGAHLGCFRAALHPILMGADACCESLSEVLSGLTGAAALHVSHNISREDAASAIALFADSHMSAPILLSAETALQEVVQRVNDWEGLALRIGSLRQLADRLGFQVSNCWLQDPCRLVIGFKCLGHDRASIRHQLAEQALRPLWLGEWWAAFECTPKNDQSERLEQLLISLSQGRRRAECTKSEQLPLPRQVMTIAQAMSCRTAELPLSRARGRIAAQTVPSGIPGLVMAVPGEELNTRMLEFLYQHGIDSVKVVK